MTEDELGKRFDYHPPNDDRKRLAHETVRVIVKHTARSLDMHLPESREKSLAYTALEEALMWANAAIARNS